MPLLQHLDIQEIISLVCNLHAFFFNCISGFATHIQYTQVDVEYIHVWF